MSSGTDSERDSQDDGLEESGDEKAPNDEIYTGNEVNHFLHHFLKVFVFAYGVFRSRLAGKNLISKFLIGNPSRLRGKEPVGLRL